jgi:hypothetical protein
VNGKPALRANVGIVTREHFVALMNVVALRVAKMRNQSFDAMKIAYAFPTQFRILFLQFKHR